MDYRSRRNVTLIFIYKIPRVRKHFILFCLLLRAINNADFDFSGLELSSSLSSSKALADFKIMPQPSLQ